MQKKKRRKQQQQKKNRRGSREGCWALKREVSWGRGAPAGSTDSAGPSEGRRVPCVLADKGQAASFRWAVNPTQLGHLTREQEQEISP